MPCSTSIYWALPDWIGVYGWSNNIFHWNTNIKSLLKFLLYFWHTAPSFIQFHSKKCLPFHSLFLSLSLSLICFHAFTQTVNKMSLIYTKWSIMDVNFFLLWNSFPFSLHSHPPVSVSSTVCSTHPTLFPRHSQLCSCHNEI